MKKNQIGFSAIEALLILVIVGIIGGVGYFVYNSQKQTDKSLSNAVSTSAATAKKKTASQTAKTEQRTPSSSQKSTVSTIKPTSIKVLEPISSTEFGDFGNVTPDQKPVYPLEPSKIGTTVNTSLYQGIVYVDAGTSRVMYGKLIDKSTGILQLSDAFEVASNKALSVAKPNLLNINSDSVIKWANLPNDHIVVRAILLYKQQNP